MLKDEIPKELFLNGLLEDMNYQPLPSLEKAKAGFDKSSNLHTLTFDYEKKEVHIGYKVVPELYEPKIVSFQIFEVIIEGLLVCRRKSKW